MMELQELLRGYAQIFGIPPITLNADGACRIGFKNEISVSLEQSNDLDRFHLFTTVSKIPQNAGVAWYRHLLDANLFGRETGQAHLGCDTQTEEVILCQVVRTALTDPNTLDSYIREIIILSDHLRRKMQSWSVLPEEKISEQDALSMIRI